MSTERQIVPGITIDKQGQANIEASMAVVLFDLALELEEPTQLPVDVQHVVAALVLAESKGDAVLNRKISASDPVLVRTLAVYVKSVFAIYGGELSSDH